VKPVVLVGLMGSGKSTIGALVAQRTARVLIDIDAAIVARTGKTVRELWEEGGEAAYRHLESQEVLTLLGSNTPAVLAAPGGVILDPAVRTALEGAFVVWLRTSPSTLARRVRPGDHRPLLGDHPYEALAAMSESRLHLYEQVATAVIDTDDVTPAVLADMVVEMVARYAADT